jgi:hypothetical protein
MRLSWLKRIGLASTLWLIGGYACDSDPTSKVAAQYIAYLWAACWILGALVLLVPQWGPSRSTSETAARRSNDRSNDMK